MEDKIWYKTKAHNIVDSKGGRIKQTRSDIPFQKFVSGCWFRNVSFGIPTEKIYRLFAQLEVSNVSGVVDRVNENTEVSKIAVQNSHGYKTFDHMGVQQSRQRILPPYVARADETNFDVDNLTFSKKNCDYTRYEEQNGEY